MSLQGRDGRGRPSDDGGFAMIDSMLRSLLIVLSFSAILAGCSSPGASSSWSFGPSLPAESPGGSEAPSAEPSTAPSVGPSPPGSTPPLAAPSGSAGPAGSPAGSGSPGASAPAGASGAPT
jgi:hypothetical protein